jgi:hypothetical protein
LGFASRPLQAYSSDAIFRDILPSELIREMSR